MMRIEAFPDLTATRLPAKPGTPTTQPRTVAVLIATAQLAREPRRRTTRSPTCSSNSRMPQAPFSWRTWIRLSHCHPPAANRAPSDPNARYPG